MPKPLSQGFTFHVDNLSSPDSIEISLQKNKYTPAEKLGLVLSAEDNYKATALLMSSIMKQSGSKVDKTNFPAGVAQAILFNSDGEILCDRLPIQQQRQPIKYSVKTSKETYEPYEAVDMEFTLTDREANPVQTPFSLSVRRHERSCVESYYPDRSTADVRNQRVRPQPVLLFRSGRLYPSLSSRPSYDGARLAPLFLEADGWYRTIRLEIQAGTRYRNARPGSFICQGKYPNRMSPSLPSCSKGRRGKSPAMRSMYLLQTAWDVSLSVQILPGNGI